MVLASILFHSYASIVTVVNISSCRFGSPKLTRFQYAPPGDGSPERHRPPRGRATAPRAPYMTAQRVIGGRTSPNAKLGERGAPKEALPRTACSVPGKAVDPWGSRGFHHFMRRSFPGFFSCPLFWDSIVWKALYRGRNTTIPPGDIFVSTSISA